MSEASDAIRIQAVRAGTSRNREPASSCDVEPAGLPLTEGLFTGTQLATAIGWRPVEAITVGDRVLTFDAGLRPVTAVRRAPMLAGEDDLCPRRHWPLQVPAWATGNRDPLLLAPEQVVLIESDRAEELYGDPFTLIPAAALAGWRGIAPVRPRRDCELVTLGFSSPQIVYGNGAILFHCPGGFAHHGSWMQDFLGADEGAEAVLDFDRACALVADLIAEDEDEAFAAAQAAVACGAKRA